MVKRPQIIHESITIRSKVLCLLHYRYAESEDYVLTAKDFLRYIKGINERILAFTLESLSETAWVKTQRTEIDEQPFYVPGYYITREGIEFVESWTAEVYEETTDGIEFLASPLDAASGTSPAASVGEHTEWEPIPLERSGETYESAVSSVEAALEEIEGNNGYASADPEERDQIVWTIKSGLDQIKEGLPNREQITTMLLKPLRYVAKKFSDASMGEIAKTAVKALLTWLAS